MRRSLSGAAIAIIAVVAIILVWTSTFVVDPTEQALVLRFGQPVRDLDWRAGPLLQDALHRHGCLYRQANSGA